MPWLESCASTNDLARELGRTGGAHGDWIAARQQTQGRGRRGADWQSLEGNLFVSFLLRAPRSRALWSWNPLLTGLAVARALRSRAPALDVQLKWPNDLWVRGLKLGGILCEAESGPEPFWVAGLGLNVTTHPKDLEATSLQAEGVQLTREACLESIHAELLQLIAQVEAQGTATLATEYLAASALGVGTQISWRAGEGGPEGLGKVLGLGPHGQLLVLLPDGEQKELFSEEVTRRVRVARRADGGSLP